MDNESIKRLMAYKPQMRKDRERAARKGKWDKAIRFAMPELAGDDIPDNFSSDGQLYTRQVSEALQGWAYGSNIDWVRITVKGLDEEERNDMEIRKWCQDVETTIKDTFDKEYQGLKDKINNLESRAKAAADAYASAKAGADNGAIPE